MRNNTPGPSKGIDAARKGFLALFGKKPKDERGKHVMKLGGKYWNLDRAHSLANVFAEMNTSVSSLLSNFDWEPENSNDGPRPGPPEMQMNWISRFLHIKPARH